MQIDNSFLVRSLFPSCRLLCLEYEQAAIQVQITPGQPRSVSKSDPCVKTAHYQPSPFLVAHCQDRSNLIDSERQPSAWIFMQEFGGIGSVAAD
jgi:hypothetical protein